MVKPRHLGVVDGLHSLPTHPLAHVHVGATIVELDVEVGVKAEVIEPGKPTKSIRLSNYSCNTKILKNYFHGRPRKVASFFKVRK
ncbi:hypothetical protein BHM03_00050401 [Ensete ventricosum]|nr:hypothetical protein BHM03_00050401 [Ensete ventricosum]